MPESKAMRPRPRGDETEYQIMRRIEKGKGYAANQEHAGCMFMAHARPEWFGGFLLGGDCLPWCRCILPDGSVFYLDAMQAEMATRVCLSAKDLLRALLGCHRVIDEIRKEHEKNGLFFEVYRNNSAIVPGNDCYDSFRAYEYYDRSSCGHHDNYSVWRFVPLEKLRDRLLPHLITRQLFAGAGKAGSDRSEPELNADYQISQRADFMYRVEGMDTTKLRALFNTHDGSHADPERFRRLHVITSDSNMLQMPSFLTSVTMDLMLSMIEDDELDDRFTLVDPVAAFLMISRDLTLREYKIEFCGNQKSMCALDMLRALTDMADDYANHYHPDEKEFHEGVKYLAEILDKMAENEWDWLSKRVDWIAKKKLIDDYFDCKGGEWNYNRARQIDIKYGLNNYEQGLYRIIEKNSVLLVPPDEVSCSSPSGGRSQFIRGIAEIFGDFVTYSDSWSSIMLKHAGHNPLYYVLKFTDPRIAYAREHHELFSLPLPEFVSAAAAHIPGFECTMYGADQEPPELDFDFDDDPDPDPYDSESFFNMPRI